MLKGSGLHRQAVRLIIQMEVEMVDTGVGTQGVESNFDVGGIGEIHHGQSCLHGFRRQNL